MKIQTKQSIVVSVIIAVIVVAITTITYFNSRDSLIDRIVSEEAAEVREMASLIEMRLRDIRQDVLFFTSVPPSNAIFRAIEADGIDPQSDDSVEVWKRRMETLFSSMLSTHPEYLQIRLIDENGMEIIYVRSEDGDIRAASEAEMQDRSQEPYFLNTIQYPIGQIYVSPMNLNREYGKIEIPHKPVVRFATPIYNNAGEAKGIIIINVLGTHIMEVVESEGMYLFLINQDGYYLKSPLGSVFGFDLGHENDDEWKIRSKRLAEKMEEMDDFAEYYNEPGNELNLPPIIQGFRKVYYFKEDKSKYWSILFLMPTTVAFSPLEPMRSLFMGMGIVSVLIGAIASYLWSFNFSRPVVELTAVANRIAENDLTVEIPRSERTDEIGVLHNTFRQMIGNLREQTRQVKEAVQVLSSSANEIMVTASQLATGSSETASALNETSTTADEIRQTVQNANQKAKLVSEQAQKSAQISEQGKKAVSDSVASMVKIQEQMSTLSDSIMLLSEKSMTISEIIASVDDLTEQSNLLAVNASIEASKAGDQGKGFAVVAQEIKNLAEQSRKSTAQIRSILNDVQKAINTAVMSTEQSNRTVQSGVKQSAQTGEVIQQLTQSITTSSQAAVQIAVTTQQQLIGIEQVTQAMNNIKEASQQNAAGTRQTEDSAKQLHELGIRLKELVEKYQL